jgi:carboxymethylenebutenolidase
LTSLDHLENSIMTLARRALVPALVAVLSASACAKRGAPADDVHAGHDTTARIATVEMAHEMTMADSALPPDGDAALARLAASPRHGEYAMIPVEGGDSVRAWVVYPERKTKAPVVIVIHEIFGLSPWIRSVADQLAADGFIAIAPDFLTGKPMPASADEAANVPGAMDSIVSMIRTLDNAQIVRRIGAAARYGTSLPAATSRWGVVGFCWGGSNAFLSAASFPTLSAAVPYYGAVQPAKMDLTKTKAAVLALYGENDARVNATIPAADSTLRIARVPFEKMIFPGAGHGFLRQQRGQNGANGTAARQAWPRTIAWFRQHLEH